MKSFFTNLKTLVVLASAVTSSVSATDYFVSIDGSDSNPGSKEAPFRTLAKATTVLGPGDNCFIRGGTYREALDISISGDPNEPIIFSAYEDEEVILHGADLLPTDLSWEVNEDGIWKVGVSEKIHTLLMRNDTMLFVGDQPQSEARWPNMKPEENWDESKKWAQMNLSQSSYGELISSAIAKSGVDFSGGVLQMKYVYNYFGSRRILAHTPGSDRVVYEKAGGFGDPESETVEKGTGGFSRWFYISGCLGALDAEGEWHYQPESKTLYFKTPDNRDPRTVELGIKARSAGIRAGEISWVNFENIHLIGCSLRLGKMRSGREQDGLACNNIKITGCKVLWPTHTRYFDIKDAATGRTMRTDGFEEDFPMIIGQNSTVESSEFGYSPLYGLYISGRGNVVRDSVIHNTSLDGRMNMSGLCLEYGNHVRFSEWRANKVVSSTIYNSGGVGLYTLGGGPHEVIKNHIFNAGLYSGDISGIYLPYGAKAQGTVMAYNWVHSIRGIGMRCDAMGREIKVHHNVVWNASAGCKWESAGGEKDTFTVYNNTIFVDSDKHPLLLSETEPAGDLLNRRDVLVENWTVMNNVSFGLKYRYWFKFWREVKRGGQPTSFDFATNETDQFCANVSLVYQNPDECFVSTDLETIDLRPKAGSPLIGAGRFPPGSQGAGSSVDVGAYQYGGNYWYPGASWIDGGREPARTMQQAVALAWHKLGDKRIFSKDASYGHK